MKFRQAVLVAPRRFEISDAEVSLPDDHILVKLQGSGMCTSELPLWTGQKADYPSVLGHEGWGVVVDKGKNVSGRVKAGDRVTGLPMKCFAEYFMQPEWCTMVLQPGLKQECVLGEPYYCVNNVVRAAHPVIGDALVVIGLGPMGQWTVQALASRALHSLIAVDIEDRKLQMALEAGATHAVNSKSCDPLETIKKITGGRMADVVVEGTGAKPGMDLAVNVLRRGPRPRLVVMSFFKKPIEIDITRLCGVSAEVIHAHPGITADRPDHCRRTEIMINNGVFKSDHLVTHRYPLDRINEGFQALENRPDGYVKGIVTP